MKEYPLTPYTPEEFARDESESIRYSLRMTLRRLMVNALNGSERERGAYWRAAGLLAGRPMSQDR